MDLSRCGGFVFSRPTATVNAPDERAPCNFLKSIINITLIIWDILTTHALDLWIFHCAEASAASRSGTRLILRPADRSPVRSIAKSVEMEVQCCDFLMRSGALIVCRSEAGCRRQIWPSGRFWLPPPPPTTDKNSSPLENQASTSENRGRCLNSQEVLKHSPAGVPGLTGMTVDRKHRLMIATCSPILEREP